MSNGMGDFLDKIYNYLIEKFPDAPRTAIDEAAGYIVSRTMVEISDAIQDRDRMWRNDILRFYESGKMHRPIRRRNDNDSDGSNGGTSESSE